MYRLQPPLFGSLSFCNFQTLSDCSSVINSLSRRCMFMAILIGLHFYIWQIDGEAGKKRPVSIYQKSNFGGIKYNKCIIHCCASSMNLNISKLFYSISHFLISKPLSVKEVKKLLRKVTIRKLQSIAKAVSWQCLLPL